MSYNKLKDTVWVDYSMGQQLLCIHYSDVDKTIKLPLWDLLSLVKSPYGHKKWAPSEFSSIIYVLEKRDPANLLSLGIHLQRNYDLTLEIYKAVLLYNDQVDPTDIDTIPSL